MCGKNRLFFFFFLCITGWLNSVCADLVVFYNGDFRYGKATIQPDGTLYLEVDGAGKYYSKSQYQQVFPGMDPPLPGVVRSASDFQQIGGGMILNVTGPITHRTTIKTQAGKEMTLYVENGFDVPILHLFPTRYGFYDRRGCFMAGVIINSGTRDWYALEMRVHLYGPEAEILSSKDFYIYNIFGSKDKGPTSRKFEIDFPDVAYEKVEKMRLVRKF